METELVHEGRPAPQQPDPDEQRWEDDGGAVPESDVVDRHPEAFPHTSAERAAADDDTPRFIRGKVYLAGPMSGIPEFNAPAFREAAARLRERGWNVVNPVEMDDEDGFDHSSVSELSEDEYRGFLRRDLQRMLADGVEGVVVLPGWEDSRGASAEVMLARTLGMPVLQYPTLEPVKQPSNWRPPSEESILEEADRLVHGDRGEDYGHPAEDFERSAMIATAILQKKLRPGERVEAREMPLLMIGVKLSRLVETPRKRDSVVDVAGYAETYAMTMERNGEELL